MRPSRPSVRALLSLLAAIRSFQPSIVQGWMPHGNIAASMAHLSRWNHAAICWNIRFTLEGQEHLPVLTRAIRRLGAFHFAHPQVVIYNSFRGRSQHEALGYPPHKGCVIPNGFDIQAWRPDAKARAEMRSVLGICDNAYVIGFVGRGHAQKDLPNLFRAFARVASRFPEVILVAVGRDLDQYDVYHERVHFLGQRNDIPSLMQAFDLLCLPSRAEGFPNVLGEAMASALPCVTTDVGDAAMIVGDTGWVVPQNDSVKLAHALIAAITCSREELRTRGRLARERIRLEFSISSVIAKYMAVYQALIQKES
jgi:glycosyltransferase involved in cell wall biosynthesis